MPSWFHPKLGTGLFWVGLLLFPLQRGALKRLLYGHSTHWPGLFMVLSLTYAFTSQVVPTSKTLYLLGFPLPQRLSFSAYPLVKMPTSSGRSPLIKPAGCDLFLSWNPLLFYTRGRQMFPVKEQRIHILGFSSYVVPVSTTQLRLCRKQSVVDNMKGMGMSVFQWNFISGH